MAEHPLNSRNRAPSSSSVASEDAPDTGRGKSRLLLHIRDIVKMGRVVKVWRSIQVSWGKHSGLPLGR